MHLRRLEALAQALVGKAGQRSAHTGFTAHVASMERFLTEHRSAVKPVRDRKASFERFLSSRTRTLASPEARVRHSRAMTLADMPDIWEDRHAAEEFEISFFEDLAYRVGTRARVVRSIVDALADRGPLETGDEMRDALTTRLDDTPWDETEWVV